MTRQSKWRQQRQQSKMCVSCNNSSIAEGNKSFCEKCWEHNKQYQRERLKRLNNERTKTIGSCPTNQRPDGDDSTITIQDRSGGKKESSPEITIKPDRRRNWQGINRFDRADQDEAATGSFRYLR